MRIFVNPVREWVGMRIEVSGALPPVNLRSPQDLQRRGGTGVQTFRASPVSLLARGGFLQQSADMPTWPARGEINIYALTFSEIWDFILNYTHIKCKRLCLCVCKCVLSPDNVSAVTAVNI